MSSPRKRGSSGCPRFLDSRLRGNDDMLQRREQFPNRRGYCGLRCLFRNQPDLPRLRCAGGCAVQPANYGGNIQGEMSEPVPKERQARGVDVFRAESALAILARIGAHGHLG